MANQCLREAPYVWWKEKIIRTRLGVKLERLKEGLPAWPEGPVTLSSRRAAGDRLILDEAEAQRAFAREVAACLVDPHIRAWRNAGSFGIETAHPSVEQASS
jgi:hypothetical protein